MPNCTLSDQENRNICNAINTLLKIDSYEAMGWYNLKTIYIFISKGVFYYFVYLIYMHGGAKEKKVYT